MKIIVCGGASDICSYLIDKLTKESHTVFHITDKTSSVHSYKSRNVTVYDIALSDDSARFIIRNVSPDVVIFLGTLDSNYNWNTVDPRQSKYLASLFNMLMISSELNVDKFIYISSYDVYGDNYLPGLTEESEISPNTVKGIVVSEGEDICRRFNDKLRTKTVSLRINNVYGPLMSPNKIGKPKDNTTNEVYEMCTEAIIEERITVSNNQSAPYTYIRDAIEAIYLIVKAEKIEHNVYNVSGGESISQKVIAQHIKSLMKNENIVVNETYEVENLAERRIDNSRFCNEFNFGEYTDVFTGSQRTLSFVRKNADTIAPPEKKTAEVDSESLKEKAKYVFGKILPFIETLIMFAVAVLLELITKDTTYLQDIDFMLMFVIFISVKYGKLQALLSVLLASAMFVAERMMEGLQFSSVLTDYELILRILVLFAIGILVGHTKDRLQERIDERDEQIKYDKTEISELSQIYETTLRIKNVLEDRLLNYGDSLAKIYSIVMELDGMIPQKILIKAIHVIMSIMGCEETAIYYCNPDSPYCRVAVSSSGLSSIAKSMKYREIAELNYVLSKREVYVNRRFDPSLPLMAAPIYRGDEMISIIMIWKIGFEKLTQYQTNLFAVLSKLITSAIQRAYLYSEAARDTKYIPNTVIFTYETMKEFYEIASEANTQFNTQFTLLEIEDDPTRSHEEISELLVASELRQYDYLGYNSRKKLVIILSNTSLDEAQFVTKRIHNRGLNASVVTNL